MSSPAKRRLSRAASFRALPAAALAALVVGALGLRLVRAPAPKPPTVANELASSRERKGAMPALPGGPSPPPKADVASGAPRMLHGGPRRNHRSEARGPRAAKVGFRTSLDVAAPDAGPVRASIAAQVVASPDGSTLYVATLDGRLVALARTDGSTRWTVALGDRAYATPLVRDDGTIYVGSDAKKLFAVAPNGEVRFR
ncbi:MAG TPA: PQQ-binding-like beta-propeller repeat protein, partial [Labilithrix sp.]